ncbi:NAD(P)H-dependent oxidoreductase [Fructobacillus fructosus]
MKLLIIQGHPDSQSFNHANAVNYYEKAQAAGHEVKMIDLAEEDFNPNLEYGFR